MLNKKNLHIVDSYKVWLPCTMKKIIFKECFYTYNSLQADVLLNRSYRGMYIEWWLHNIGYYLTKPLCKIPYFKALNDRFKDADLEEWSDNE